MQDRFGRTITYLRISVTDRCNLRCRYCMPAEGVPLLRHEDILSLEEIAAVARTAASLGVDKLRLTGGEPLVRRNLVHLVRLLAAVPGIRDFGMTTNGILLADHAAALAEAGLHRVNVSLDTLDPARYATITRGGDLHAVLRGIRAARRAGLEPIKLNCVVSHDSNEPDARSVAAFARAHGYQARFIHQMDAATGSFTVVEGGDGGDCPRCNRLRLSANGLVLPCLFSDLGYSVRELGAEQALRQAVAHKPKAGGPCAHNWIRAAGG